jgi:hypothetical protein
MASSKKVKILRRGIESQSLKVEAFRLLGYNAVYSTEVSDEHAASIFRVDE